jgi:hypothetical protein
MWRIKSPDAIAYHSDISAAYSRWRFFMRMVGVDPDATFEA